MRLRYVATADFRKSERTMFLEAQSELPALRKGDVVAFVSTGRNQMVFVTVATEMESANVPDKQVRIWSSRRLRIEGGTWSPLMLVNYAEQVGLQLDGLKRFEDHLRK